jgi:hypothetical protein
MTSLNDAWKTENLNRAWRWIRSNPDASYKSNFRELYSAYSTADEALLAHLKNRLDRGIFQPSDSCKLYLPKPSGIMRPYTLLGIEDQIVYQSMANVIAERLLPHVKARYNKQIFGHQYAGKSSMWFYRKWTSGYKAFNLATETAFNNGYVWAASFDLTAFYDSIDHGVLRHMLSGLGLEQDFCDTFTTLLNRWTATRTQIYHNHGIPQGPLSSGIVSEAVLKHFDANFKPRFDVFYFRYVDDIRLFAKNEDHLRYALVQLDHLSKDVGLFPQSSKIDIHRVKDISEVLKSVSVPPEAALTGPVPDQVKIRTRIAELAPRSDGYKVSDPTRFKFLLSRAKPSLRVLDRLWRVFDNAPHFYPQLSNYLQKFDSLSNLHSERLVAEIQKQDLYPAVRASLIAAADGRLSATTIKRFRSLIKPFWQPRSTSPDLAAVLWRALHNLNHLTQAQADYALHRAHSDWLRMSLHFGTPWFNIPPARRDRLLNLSIRKSDADSAIAAAWLIALLDVEIKRPIRDVHPLAKIVLRENGKLKRADSKVCGIRMAIDEISGGNLTINWRKFFGKSYSQAEVKIVACKGYLKTNPTAWVNMLDVFNDLMLDLLFQRDGTIGSRNLGNFGGVTHNTKFIAKYPKTHAYVVLIHEKRLESELSHAVVKGTNAPTTRIPFKWLRTGQRALLTALAELSGLGY